MRDGKLDTLGYFLFFLAVALADSGPESVNVARLVSRLLKAAPP